jgi:hypothetical protein
MNTEDAAQAMVSYYASVTPVIRNHPIFLQYSNHQELKTDNSPNQVVSHVHVVCILLNFSQPFICSGVLLWKAIREVVGLHMDLTQGLFIKIVLFVGSAEQRL